MEGGHGSAMEEGGVRATAKLRRLLLLMLQHGCGEGSQRLAADRAGLPARRGAQRNDGHQNGGRAVASAGSAGLHSEARVVVVTSITGTRARELDWPYIC
ncbi:hypothetical protein MTO96_010016 [Rhipicephalus appendiculatus]